MRGERRWMGCFQDIVPVAIDQAGLGLGVSPPEQEDQAAVLRGKLGDRCIREPLPPPAMVRSGLVFTNGQGGVKQERALSGPWLQVPMGWLWNSQVTRDLGKDVLQ